MNQVAIINAKNPPKPFENRKYEWGEIVKCQGQTFKVYACHDAQLDILRSKAKFTFGFAGTGGGKTVVMPLKMYKRVGECYAAGNKNPRLLLVSPSVNTFRKSQLKQHLINTFDNTPLHGTWKESEKTYKIHSGGEVVVATVGDGSDYQKLSGGQYDFVGADEVYFLTYEVWEEIRRRGGQKNCPVLAITTPNANNWIYDIKQKFEAGDPDYYVRQWGSIDNPTYSKQHLDSERQVMGEAAFKRMYEGQFSALEGLIYSDFSDPSADNYPVLKGDPFKDGLPSPVARFFGGNDWGYSPDPACILMFAECEDGNMYAVDELYGTKITPDVMAIRARELVDKWAVRSDFQYGELITGGRFSMFYSDVSRPEQAAMFRTAGVPIRNKKIADIATGLHSTDQWFKAGQLFVYESCPNLIRELRGYQWDTSRTGGLKDTPKGGADHAVDALRYAISTHKYGMAARKTVRVALDESAELQKAINLKLLDADPLPKLKELEAEQQKERFSDMVYGNAEDDDPYGIWG